MLLLFLCHIFLVLTKWLFLFHSTALAIHPLSQQITFNDCGLMVIFNFSPISTGSPSTCTGPLSSLIIVMSFPGIISTYSDWSALFVNKWNTIFGNRYSRNFFTIHASIAPSLIDAWGAIYALLPYCGELATLTIKASLLCSFPSIVRV